MSLDAYIARQPIVDGKHQLIAYELLFRDAAHTQSAHIVNAHQAGIEVISNVLFNMGTDWLLKGKHAFINMDSDMLMSEFSALLPPDKVVIELLDDVQATPEVLARIEELKQAGFRFALDNFTFRPQIQPLLALASYVKFDVRAHSPAQIAHMIKQVRHYPVICVAEKVEKPDQFNYYRDMGCEYFQGYYFTHPETLSAKVVNPTRAVVIQLMEKVRQEADLRLIEQDFKRDVSLTFKLLRYINSAGFGLTCEVQSIRHAVSILGYRPLLKWLTLLLATASTSPMAPALSRTAVTRGRFCELIGGHCLERSELDNLFIVGVFSLLDALLESPMQEILDRVSVTEAVADALLTHSGLYGPILSLAEACEEGNAERIAELADSLILSPAQVNDAHLKAIAWAEQLGLD